MKSAVLFVIGAVLGAAIVLGVGLTFDPEEPAKPIEVADDFCDRALESLADKWSLEIAPQGTSTGARDELTSCAAEAEEGIVEATVTVLALGADADRSRDQRIDAAVDYACDQIGVAPEDQECTGPVEGGAGPVGRATTFLTSDDGAVVTVVLTGPADRLDDLDEDLESLRRALGRESVLTSA